MKQQLDDLFGQIKKWRPSEPSPFIIGIIATSLFSALTALYYQNPSYRHRESPNWVQAFSTLHEKSIDWRFKNRGSLPTDKTPIALIVVDDGAVERLGRWPWPRNIIADMIEELMKNDARLIGFDSIFSEPENSEVLETLKEIEPQVQNTSSRLKQNLERKIQKLDHDRQLSQTIYKYQNRLVMGSYFDEQGFEVDKNGKQYPLLLPYQEHCLEASLPERPDAIAIQKNSPEVFVQDDSVTEISSSVQELLKQLHQQEEESTIQTLKEKEPHLSPSEIQQRVRWAQLQYCRTWLTSEDKYISGVKDVWPEIQKADPNLSNISFETFQDKMVHSHETLRNPIIAMERLWINIPQLQDVTKTIGYFNAFLSLDGTLRKSHLVARLGQRILPSLSLKLAQLHFQNDIALSFTPDPFYSDSKKIQSLKFMKDGADQSKIPVDGAGSILINYAGPRYTFPHVSVADLLSGQDQLKITIRNNGHPQTTTVSKKDFIKNRIFLFGATATGIFDLRVTPFDENFPGLETHANILSNILNSNYLTAHPSEARLMPWIVLSVGVLLSFLLARVGAINGLLVTLAFLLITYELDKWLFEKGIVVTIIFPVIVIFFVDYILLTLYKYFTEERRKKELKGTFQKYVSPQIVDQILKHPENLQLGGRKQRMSVIFSDVRGFTTISEKLEPTALSDVLNLYLSPMTKLVFKHQGTLDKYMGDAIMAFFGAPIFFPHHAVAACRCALDMMKQLAELNVEFAARKLPPIDIGIGINTGDMSVGNMGSDIVRSYTVMGDAVNLGSRLEGINKSYGTHIMLSEFTYAEVATDFYCREIDWVRVKGKTQPVKIFELMGEGQPPSHTKELLKEFEQGASFYHQGNWDQAMIHFQNCLKLLPTDEPSRLYIERCQYFKISPPPSPWDGVYSMKEK